MDFRRINEDLLEILPAEHSREEILVERARSSYETADSPLPCFVHPFEVPATQVVFIAGRWTRCLRSFELSR
jgi:hypothetical protein